MKKEIVITGPGMYRQRDGKVVELVPLSQECPVGRTYYAVGYRWIIKDETSLYRGTYMPCGSFNKNPDSERPEDIVSRVEEKEPAFCITGLGEYLDRHGNVVCIYRALTSGYLFDRGYRWGSADYRCFTQAGKFLSDGSYSIFDIVAKLSRAPEVPVAAADEDTVPPQKLSAFERYEAYVARRDNGTAVTLRLHHNNEQVRAKFTESTTRDPSGRTLIVFTRDTTELALAAVMDVLEGEA